VSGWDEWYELQHGYGCSCDGCDPRPPRCTECDEELRYESGEVCDKCNGSRAVVRT
jgi:hypothetical protein